MQETKKPISEECKRLKQFRKREKISQQILAAHFDVTQPAISKWENGELDIPLRVPKFLHDKYLMNYDWFFNGKPPMKLNKIERPTVSADLSSIRSDYELLTKKVQSLESFVKSLASKLHDRG